MWWEAPDGRRWQQVRVAGCRSTRPVLSTIDSMSNSIHDAKSVTTQGEPITDLRDYRCGNEVAFGDRQRTLMVTVLGEREIIDERISETITTPLVRVQGDWAGAVDRVLAHSINLADEIKTGIEELVDKSHCPQHECSARDPADRGSA